MIDIDHRGIGNIDYHSTPTGLVSTSVSAFTAYVTPTTVGLRQSTKKNAHLAKPVSRERGGSDIKLTAKGDKPALKNLLSKEVFDGFAKAIDSRGQAGEKLDFQFVGFEKVDFVSVSLAGKRASIVVKFASQMISATHDKAGALIDGNPRSQGHHRYLDL